MKSTQRDRYLLIGIAMLILMLFCANLFLGSVHIPVKDVLTLLSGGQVENESWAYIVESRLNRTLTAFGAGGALALAGLILQVFFRNPLAGPGVLGITSGASLGVALVLLGGFGLGTSVAWVSLLFSGVSGALAVLFMLILISRFIRNSLTLLVVGLMFGYFTSALTSILFLWADLAGTREYVVWSLGSFEGLSTGQTWIFFGGILLLLVLSMLLIKPLNALVMGEDYARSMGLNMSAVRRQIILITGLLAAVVTVYCGPVSFIGIAVPQLVRLSVKNQHQGFIIPFTFLCGAGLAIFADILVRWSENALPLNTVTALIGAPVIILTIVRLNRHAEL